MPKVRTSRTRRAPEGFEQLKDELAQLEQKMREVEAEPHEGKRKVESAWGVFRVNHERSRLVYNRYFVEKSISKDVFDYCLRERYADKALIAKWRKPGYERLCCLQCIQQQTHGGVCVCRVPSRQLDNAVECQSCGCRGCASGG